MTITLHRCPLTFIKTKGHGCLSVQRALEDMNIAHEVVLVPLRRPRRTRVVAMTGQQLVPVIEFGDGTSYRAESAEMAARIRAGGLAL